MQKTLAELAKLVEGEVVGDKNVLVSGLNGIEEAKSGELTFVANPKYYSAIKTTKASAVIIPNNLAASGKPFIKVKNPSLAFAKIAEFFSPRISDRWRGIHKTALIAEDAQIGKNVSIGPYVVIESKTKIGDNTVIYPHCYIGEEVVVGSNCLFYANVTIRERLSLGSGVIIHSGSVIGSDGFGYEPTEKGLFKIPQLGTVVIEDDVEIGANVTVDRARFHMTFIGKGTKIDNLVHVAHNVIIGENCILVSHVAIGGTVKIGKNCILAGQVGVAGHLTIGEGSRIAGQSSVMKSVPPGSMIWGTPGRPQLEAQRSAAALQKLPKYIKKIQDLEKKVQELQVQLKNKK